MGIQRLQQAFDENIAAYGQAPKVVYASGGLMAYHDGVNSAVAAFWNAAENYIDSVERTKEDDKKLDDMHSDIMNLVINANTAIENIVGNARYERVLNAL